MKKFLIVMSILSFTLTCSAASAVIEFIPSPSVVKEAINLEDFIYNSIPVQGNGIYLQCDTSKATLPDQYKPVNMTNSPMYVYDNDKNLIKTVNFENYLSVISFYEGYFYFTETTYGQTSITYRRLKSVCGDEFIEISEEEFKDAVLSKKLYNQTIYKKEDEVIENNGITNISEGRLETIKKNDNCYRIRREDENRITYKKIVPATKFNVIVYKVKNDIYSTDRTDVQTKISLDGVSAITVPDDANSDEMWNDETYLYIGSKAEPDCCYRIRLSDIDGYIKVICNGEYLSFEEPPAVEEDYTLVPMRFLFEKMGAEVDWDEDSRTATVRQADRSVAFSIDNLEARVNSAPVEMQIPARLINGKTMVPLRFLSENLGYTVDWDAGTKTAVITTN